jgi:hypothetical protein
MNKKELISSKQIYRILGIKKHRSTWTKFWIKNLNLKENIDYIINKCESTGGRPLIDYMFTKESISSIITRCNSKNIKEAMDYIGLEVKHIHTYDRFEISFSKMLKDFFPEIEFEEQKQVGKYRIDFFYDYLIIEYDEEHHKHNEEKDAIRTAKLLNELYLNKSKEEKDSIFYKINVIRVKKGNEIKGLREISDYFEFKKELNRNPLEKIIANMIIEKRESEKWVNNIIDNI